MESTYSSNTQMPQLIVNIIQTDNYIFHSA